MSPTAKGINTKWKNNRYGHPFKLRIGRAGYRKFIIDDFQLFCPDVKVWGIQITGCKACTVSKGCVFGYFFYLFRIYIQLPFVIVRVLSQCTLRLDIELYSIADSSLPPLHNSWLA